MTRAAFEAAWPAAVEAQARLIACHDFDHPMNVAMREAVIAEASKRGRKPKDFAAARKRLDKSAPEVLATILSASNDAAQVYYAGCKKERDAAEAALKVAAADAEVYSGPEGLLLHTSSSSTWSSQGFGAKKYASASAEAVAAEAAAHGVRVEVAETNCRTSGGLWGLDHADYEVRAWVASDLDLAILRRKPGLPLREWVKGCWKRGCNPRVYNPYLPHGYEEEQGIDYQGNDLRVAATK